MSVSLSQKGSRVIATAEADGSELVSSHESAIESLDAQRAAGLEPRTDGKISTPLTQQEIDNVNSTYDALVASENRMFQIRLLDLCRSEISKSIDATAYSDVDISTEKTARKAKVDAELDAKVAARPSVDVDALQAASVAEIKG